MREKAGDHARVTQASAGETRALATMTDTRARAGTLVSLANRWQNASDARAYARKKGESGIPYFLVRL